jgi:hypothetical protein
VVSFKVWAIESNDTQSVYPDSNPTGGFSDPTVTITEVWVVGHTAGEPKIAPVDISGLAVGSTQVLAYGMSVTRNADGSVTFSGVEQGDSYGIGTGSNTFNAVDVQDVTGKFDLGIFALTTTNLGNPIDLSLGVTATDHDGDTSTGTIGVSLIPASSSSSAAVIHSALAASSLSTSSTDTSHLVSTNDNHRTFEEHRAANYALLGAVAAAGLAASHQVAAETIHVPSFGAHSGPIMAPQVQLSPQFMVRDGGTHDASVQPTHIVAPDHLMTTTHLSSSTNGALHGLAGQDHGGHQSVTQLLAATEGHVMSHGPAPLTSSAIAIPPAQLLAAHMGGGTGGVEGAQAVATGVHSGGVVARVLADALAGGHGHGPNIDALLHNATGHGHGNAQDALANLASHGSDSVSNGHSGVFAGFHSAPIMEHMMVIHQDAPAQH